MKCHPAVRLTLRAPIQGRDCFVFLLWAGAGMDHAFMVSMTHELAARGVAGGGPKRGAALAGSAP